MIQVNPAFLSLSKKNKTTKNRKKKRKDLRMSIKPNNIKKKLIAKIKEHQKEKLGERQNKAIQEENKNKETFTKDFNDQLKYLEQIIQKKKEKRMRKKMRRKTKKRGIIMQPSIKPHALIKNNIKEKKTYLSRKIQPDPPYGCLKNGNKPTYSQYRKTLRMREVKKPKLSQNELNPKPTVLIEPDTIEPKLISREDKLEKLKKRLALPKTDGPMQKFVKVKKP